MPHAYTLYKTDQCKCQILGTGYHCGAKGLEDFTCFPHNQSLYRPLNSKEIVTTKYSVWHTIIESIYEKCATYNLKYCPIWGFKVYDGYFSKTVKDFIILACFMIANFVVFITLFTKTIVHMYYVVFVLAEWLISIWLRTYNFVSGRCVTIVSAVSQMSLFPRYCPIRGFTKHDGYISHAVMDFIILVCFVVANFIVFVTIFAKTLVHLYYVALMFLKWVTRPRQDIKEHDFGDKPITVSVTRIAEALMAMKKDQAAQLNSKDEPAHVDATTDAPRVTAKVSHWVRQSKLSKWLC